MTDRKVRQISPAVEEQEPQPFSIFADRPNLVLLGDPGAGKTHLFRETALAAGGRLLSARTFLNIPSLPANAVLFIDGLDEQRAGRGDRGRSMFVRR